MVGILKKDLAMPDKLDSIFRPTSVAVIGASARKGAIGEAILRNIINSQYSGQMFPVNPKDQTILDLPCYQSIADIPSQVELAVIIVPRDHVLPTVEKCGQKGVKGIICITAGFREVGEEGRAKEQELMEVVRRYDMRMVGPNCFGVLNSDNEINLNATFTKTKPLTGNVGFISQSGALGEAILCYATELHIGFSKFISIGNKADISDVEVLRYFHADPNTEIILFYLENLDDPTAFLKTAKEIVKTKPIVVVKSGRTEAGAKAISSHTGALAGADSAVDALFAQAGVIRAHTMEEMFDITVALTQQPLPRGDRVAIITNAGGPGILATDAVASLGMSVTTFNDSTIKELRDNLSAVAALTNPVDVIASAGPKEYGIAVDAVLSDENVDAVILIFVPPVLVDHHSVIRSIIKSVKEHSANRKPVLACFMTVPKSVVGYYDMVEAHIPVFIFPESAVNALSRMLEYSRYLNRPTTTTTRFYCDCDIEQVDDIIGNAIKKKQKAIVGFDALRILSAYGINVVKSAHAKNVEQAVQVAQVLGYPLFMKIDDPLVLHKTDQGGVISGLMFDDDIIAGFEKMKDIFSDDNGYFAGVTIQKTAQSGVETIIGMERDDLFGPIVMFGLGGVSVEVLQDVVFRVCPLTDFDAVKMVHSVKGFALLDGFRGKPKSDLVQLQETILKIAQLAEDFPQIHSVEINPFISNAEGQTSVAVDARLLLGNSYKCKPLNGLC